MCDLARKAISFTFLPLFASNICLSYLSLHSLGPFPPTAGWRKNTARACESGWLEARMARLADRCESPNDISHYWSRRTHTARWHISRPSQVHDRKRARERKRRWRCGGGERHRFCQNRYNASLSLWWVLCGWGSTRRRGGDPPPRAPNAAPPGTRPELAPKSGPENTSKKCILVLSLAPLRGWRRRGLGLTGWGWTNERTDGWRESQGSTNGEVVHPPRAEL